MNVFEYVFPGNSPNLGIGYKLGEDFLATKRGFAYATLLKEESRNSTIRGESVDDDKAIADLKQKVVKIQGVAEA